MPAKKKKNSSVKTDSPFVVPIEKKKKIAGFLIIVLALLIFLSILSYSSYDQANLSYRFTDLFKIFSNDPEFLRRVETTRNWLGIFGAYISSFFIHATLGYFSFVFPALLFMWGYYIIKRENAKLTLYISNFLIAVAVILASFFGLLTAEYGVLADTPELSGKVGLFFGTGIGRLLGGLGGIIFFTALMFVTIFVVFDINFTKIWTFLKSFWDEASGSEPEKEKVKIVKNEDDNDEEEADNLEIIKRLSKKQKKTDKLPVEIEELPEEPSGGDDEEPLIRIVKRDESENIIEPEYMDEEETGDTENKKQKDDTELPPVDYEKEKDLPDQWEEKIKFKPPTLDLLEKPDENEIKIPEAELKKNAELLKQKLALFDIEIEDISVTPGPVVALYEIVPAPGVKISRIVNLENDIALALAARGIRIIAPIPGKSAIGVEIPNAEAETVGARSVIRKIKETKAILPLALGKTISGDVYITDLASMPHLLIAGSTGSGKSVGINMMLTSLLYAKHPSEIKFVIIDPKKIELSFYQKLNKHYLAVSPDIDEEIITNPQNALLVLKSVIYEMENRYTKLAKVGVRNIVDYNNKVSDPKRRPKDTAEMQFYKMPYIIVVIDELADLMMTSGKEVEEPIARLAQLARAVGIHLIVATQRPSVNVITGVIKANFSARVAYQVATKIDSRTILDMNGAERLLGRGDMLFLPGGHPKPVRIQNAFISTDEVEKVTNHIYIQEGYSKRYFLPSMFEKQNESSASFLAELDPMFEDAARVIVTHQQGSVSLLQRKLKLGYSRAARIVDQLEHAGIVGPSEGSKAREVIVENEDQLEALLRSL